VHQGLHGALIQQVGPSSSRSRRSRRWGHKSAVIGASRSLPSGVPADAGQAGCRDAISTGAGGSPGLQSVSGVAFRRSLGGLSVALLTGDLGLVMASLRGFHRLTRMVFTALRFALRHRRLGRRCSWSGAGCSCPKPRRLEVLAESRPRLLARKLSRPPSRITPAKRIKLRPRLSAGPKQLQDARILQQRPAHRPLSRRRVPRRRLRVTPLRARTVAPGRALWALLGSQVGLQMPAKAATPALVKGPKRGAGSRKRCFPDPMSPGSPLA